MSEIFDERRKALEDEYFRRKERETLDKLREQLAAEAAASGHAAGRLCPLGHGTLLEEARGSVVIDRCEKCGGIWLDQGELEEVTRQGGGWFDNFVRSFKNE
ncbi:MAG TPA: zf-TFIIB domain-containing protein [Pyrinomonadaceae bacterium]|nr:zf-TFIIB domain-containing protein [Pyrinomonadaceae bacterium]